MRRHHFSRPIRGALHRPQHHRRRCARHRRRSRKLDVIVDDGGTLRRRQSSRRALACSCATLRQHCCGIASLAPPASTACVLVSMGSVGWSGVTAYKPATRRSVFPQAQSRSIHRLSQLDLFVILRSSPPPAFIRRFHPQIHLRAPRTGGRECAGPCRGETLPSMSAMYIPAHL